MLYILLFLSLGLRPVRKVLGSEVWAINKLWNLEIGLEGLKELSLVRTGLESPQRNCKL